MHQGGSRRRPGNTLRGSLVSGKPPPRGHRLDRAAQARQQPPTTGERGGLAAGGGSGERRGACSRDSARSPGRRSGRQPPAGGRMVGGRRPEAREGGGRHDRAARPGAGGIRANAQRAGFARTAPGPGPDGSALAEGPRQRGALEAASVVGPHPLAAELDRTARVGGHVGDGHADARGIELRLRRAR